MKIEKLARKGILDLPTYVPGKAIEEVEKEYGKKNWVKLASNENLLGPSPRAIRAMQKELREVYFYPEGPCTVLKRALAEKFSISENRVCISNGADNLILMIANAFVDEGDEVVMADPTFSLYANVTRIMGGVPVKVPLRDFTHDLAAMRRKIGKKTKIVLVCNPNNPTGTIVSKHAFEAFLSKLPARVIVVLDEAYADFVEDAFYPNGLDYIGADQQVIVLRTFSKVYGLAGVRVGYALGREDLMRRSTGDRAPDLFEGLRSCRRESRLRPRTGGPDRLPQSCEGCLPGQPACPGCGSGGPRGCRSRGQIDPARIRGKEVSVQGTR
jgi:histidinol-phosphate aminotransferase